MFVLLSGSYPYAGSTNHELRDAIRNSQGPDMTTRVWRRVSEEAKDLVRLLLKTDPKQRVKAKDALEHPWFKKNVKPPLQAPEMVEIRRRNSKLLATDSSFDLKRSNTLNEEGLDPEVILSL